MGNGDIHINTILDEKYLVLKKLGAGGFGKVYLTRDVLLKERYVALKHLKIEDDSRKKDLIREMEFLSKLADPHVVRFYHHFRYDDKLFLVMEYCPGGSLRQLLQRNGPLPYHSVAQWLTKVCDTLQKVHANEIVHHDIKPDNILFTRDGTPKVADFGVANTRGGTVIYLSPELFIANENVSRLDGRVDIYALGTTLLEAVTGENPFSRFSDDELLKAKVQIDFVPSDVPEWLREIILKAMHPKPELRFQSMLEFKEAIEARHVPYIFDRKRIQASRAVRRAENFITRKRYLTALKILRQALKQDKYCLEALISAGRCNLIMGKIEDARMFFERAIEINPRANIQKQLGWIYLEKGRYPEAISMLNDHLQRRAADYEAYHLLAKVFYETDRYDAAAELIEVVLKDYAENSCFENNLMLCHMLNAEPEDRFERYRQKTNPFIDHNLKIYLERPASWDSGGRVSLKSKLVFQEFSHDGRRKSSENTIVIEDNNAQRWTYAKPIISFGRFEDNDLRIAHDCASRRHCLLVNYDENVWLYDLGSTHGTYLDGSPVKKPVFLDRGSSVRICDTEFAIFPKEGMLF
jgi:serine/threonine protein kinase